MELPVFLAVLAAAAFHAGWNAVVKGAADPLVSMTVVMTAAGIAAALALPFAGSVAPAAWPWLAASVAIHIVYFLLVVAAYKAGDMAQVYPIMRGAAPLMTAVATAILLQESIGARGFAAVGVLSAGIFLMSFKGGRLGAPNKAAVAWALASAVSTCAYTLVDGLGGRASGAPVAYTLWMFALNMFGLLGAAVLWRGTSILRDAARSWWPTAIGGALSVPAYAVAIWAMTKAPIALVAALRETSVLFAALIAVVALKEPMTGWRLAASALVVAGTGLLRLA